ncbi:MHS family MFS transporter [Arthrobacter sp. CDRTa11]|uniref:MFS transporter n=1 Tax=Arthrobacter sp. CDRTa11 TaxID=2651199 RepID=UPI002265B0C8|nr:MFS transporter [Arthrobacter sp. CDRTa11]UZX02845.1 MHS family MFS transporter [Arthrobacter sp. CDRTa11]
MSELKKDETARVVRFRAIAGSVIGTALEWYDFFLYGTAAALVFNQLFFPKFDPLTGTLLAFASFAVGFVARPIGAIVFGNFGDRIGRKKVLVLTLVIMGVATMLIGLVPTYEVAGIWAPIALTVLRFIQGFGLGGEWGGAVLMSLEHGDPKRRGFAASWPQIGVPLGLLMANGILALMFLVTSPADFLAWGWRIPFLLSALLVGVGLWIRFRVTESPEFEELAASGKQAKMPIIEVLRTQKRELLISTGSRIGTDVAFYIYVLFVVTYLTQMVGVSQSVALLAVLVSAGVMVVLIPLFGSLSDRVGRRPVYLAGALGALIWVFAFFPLLGTGNTLLILLADVVGMTCWAAMYGPLAAFTTELFPTRVRYSGASLGYQMAGILGGAFAPIIAVALYGQFGTWLPVAIYVSVMLLITIISVSIARETSKDLHGSMDKILAERA